MRRWRLMQGDLAIAELTEVGRDMWNVTCQVALTGAFEALREVFDRKARLAEQLEDVDDDDLHARWEALEIATSPPALRLLAPDGATQDFGLLYMDADGAGFRLV
jgi:hypothetical protein